MARFLLVMLVGLVASGAMAEGIDTIHCEETHEGARQIVFFERGDFRLIETDERFNAQGSIYLKQDLIVLSKNSVCGVPVNFSDCEIKDDVIGETQTLEVVCHNRNGTTYANMALTVRRAGDSWNMRRICGTAISSHFREESFGNCRVN